MAAKTLPFHELDRKYQGLLIRRNSPRVPPGFVLPSTRNKPWHELSPIRQRVLIKQGTDPRIPIGATAPECPKYTRPSKAEWDQTPMKEKIDLFWANDKRVPKGWQPPYEKAWRAHRPGKDNASRAKKVTEVKDEYKPVLRDPPSPGMLGLKGKVPDELIGLTYTELLIALKRYVSSGALNEAIERDDELIDGDDAYELAYKNPVRYGTGTPNWAETCRRLNVDYIGFKGWRYQQRNKTETSAAPASTSLDGEVTHSAHE